MARVCFVPMDMSQCVHSSTISAFCQIVVVIIGGHLAQRVSSLRLILSAVTSMTWIAPIRLPGAARQCNVCLNLESDVK